MAIRALKGNKSEKGGNIFEKNKAPLIYDLMSCISKKKKLKQKRY
jgi:hypothetical protein